MDPQDYTKSQVILKMLCYIYDNPALTPGDLQRKLGISRDRYFRYFTELSQIINLSYNRKEKSFILNPPLNMKGLLGDYREFAVFLILLRALMKEEGSGTSGAFGRIRHILGLGPDFDYMEKYVAGLERHILDQNTKSYLSLLFGAIILRKKVRLSYRPVDSAVFDMEVEPYRLIHFRDSFYLLGLPEGKRELRNYRLSRIERLEVTQKSFTMPDAVDIQSPGAPWDFGEGSPVKVRIRMSGKAAVCRIRGNAFHPAQELRELTGGEMEFAVTVRSPERMIPWILSFGRHAEVLEPESLKGMVIRELDNTRSLYAETAPDTLKEACGSRF